MRKVESRVVGWVVIHRDIWSDRDLAKCAATRHFYLYLISMVEFKEVGSVFEGKPIRLKPGQLVTGYRELATHFGCSKSQVERYIDKLRRMDLISTKSDNLGTLVTVHNYSKYQINGVPPDNDRDTDRDADRDTDRDADRDYQQNKKQETRNQEQAAETVTASVTPDGVSGAGEGPGEPKSQSPDFKTQLSLLPETVGEPPLPPLAAPGQTNAAFHVEQPSIPAPVDAEKARKVEVAIWVRAIYEYARAVYIQCGLNETVYPSMDGKLSGRIRVYLEKLGDKSNLHLGAQKLVHAIEVNAERFMREGSGYWHPTLDSMLQKDKMSKLLGDIHLYDMPDYVPQFPKLFMDFAKMRVEAERRDAAGEPPEHPVRDVGPKPAEALMLPPDDEEWDDEPEIEH